MRIFINFIHILLFVFSSILIAADSDVFYKNTKGSLETVQGFSIPTDSFYKLVSINSPYVTVKAYDKDGEELNNGNGLELSKYWFERASVRTSFSDVVELISRPLELDPAEEIRLEDCIRPNRATDIIRPIDGSADIRIGDNLGSYFKCYQKSSSAMTRYKTSIAPAIKKISKNYIQAWQAPLPSEEFETLMSCLIFRESSHFKGNSSPTGAVGIGQFTGTAIRHIKKVINLRPQSNFQSRLAPRIEKLNNNTLSASQRSIIEKEVELIRAEKRNYERALAAKNFFENYQSSNKPTANQLNDNYFKNKANDEMVLVFSMMMVMDCEVKLIQSSSALLPSDRLLACMGAYNMGVRGFYRYALRGNESDSLGDWVANLKASSSSQKYETINHLISINRCANKNSNYPPCGTRSSYCQDLDNTNMCADPDTLKCKGECR